MRKISSFTFYVCAIAITLLFMSCENKKDIDYKEMHVYQPDEVEKIIAHAYKFEMSGSPVIKKTSDYDSVKNVTTTQINTTQVYLAYVGLNDDNTMMPPDKVDTVKAMARRGFGPIVLSVTCGMNCQSTGATICPDATGCSGAGKPGCSEGSCGSGCTTSKGCAKENGFGFGFGGVIRF